MNSSSTKDEFYRLFDQAARASGGNDYQYKTVAHQD